MQTINSPSEMQKKALAWRRAGKKIALVPTMGALHEGHVSLVRLARRSADVVVVSIFVNPTQFGAGEDFKKYPRNLEHDGKLCRESGVDVVFNPSVKDMYPEKGVPYSTYRNFNVGCTIRKVGPDCQSGRLLEERRDKAIAPYRSETDMTDLYIEETDLSQQLCGKFRPGHFRGVLTVVAKLFNIVLPDLAVFGQKDAQQAILIRRMTRDLNFPIRLVVAPIVREPDGLAVSSRNSYLDPAERKRACCLSAALRKARALYRAGKRDCAALKKAMREIIDRAKPEAIDYIEIVAERDLKPIDKVTKDNCLIALAVRIGKTRLIDNLPLPDDRLGNLPE